MHVTIRDEDPSDFERVEAIHAAAFGGFLERDVVRAIRASGGYRADRSFVASASAIGVVGHLLTSPVGLEGPDGIVREVTIFAPLAVDPDYQGRGIGTTLMQRAISYYDDQNYPLLVLRGDLAYYKRFGFTESVEHAVRPPFASAPDHYLARQLAAYDDRYQGTVRYPSTFASVGYAPQWVYQ